MNRILIMVLVLVVVIGGAGAILAGYLWSVNTGKIQAEDCSGRLCTLRDIIINEGE